eukprot:TRINITY_DN5228_c4_g1_i1.p1 TRINITY_DN5228_c4_g1~~TRINITY_DN5228_c4_g1_i1.p1  ORF type:complete len:619 (+),score=168.00 TRINITY_DN5228_c4_g1_i1:95-1858(+)
MAAASGAPSRAAAYGVLKPVPLRPQPSPGAAGAGAAAGSPRRGARPQRPPLHVPPKPEPAPEPPAPQQPQQQQLLLSPEQRCAPPRHRLRLSRKMLCVGDLGGPELRNLRDAGSCSATGPLSATTGGGAYAGHHSGPAASAATTAASPVHARPGAPAVASARAALRYLECSYSAERDAFRHTLPPAQLAALCLTAAAAGGGACRELPAVVQLSSPLYALGDIHGRFCDLLSLLRLIAPFGDFRFSPTKVLLLGDYVDRGEHSVEVAAYLLAMRAVHPGKVFLLRGNHEDRSVNGDVGTYGETSFYAQCIALLGEDGGGRFWAAANEAFEQLPLAAVVDGAVFAAHGGVPRPPPGQPAALLAELAQLPRYPSLLPSSPEEERDAQMQLARDVVWADPAAAEGALGDDGFGESQRCTDGTLAEFGNVAVSRFLAANGLDYIVRAHQCRSSGVHVSKQGRVVTVFSCSDYCGGSNRAGVIYIAESKIRLVACTMAALRRRLGPCGQSHGPSGRTASAAAPSGGSAAGSETDPSSGDDLGRGAVFSGIRGWEHAGSSDASDDSDYGAECAEEGCGAPSAGPARFAPGGLVG